MDPMQESLRYLELRLAQCQRRPELHPHQIEAYGFFLQLAQSASDAEDYLRAIRRTGDMYQLARAELMDRHRALSRVQRALSAEPQMRAEALCFTAADGATSHVELNQRMTDTTPKAAQQQQAARAAASQIRDLLTRLLDWAMAAGPQAREARRISLQQSWRQLQHHDPGCSWDKLCAYPPFRQRIPFDDERLAQLGQWFQEARL